MTARWVADLDAPVAFTLTDAGWHAAAVASTQLLEEASRACGLAPAYVTGVVELAPVGNVEGVKVDGQWLVEAGAS